MRSPGEENLDGIEIRAATEVPPAALEDFYDVMYPRRSSFLKAHRRWVYRLESHSSISPRVVMLGDQVIGHAGLTPVTLRHNEEERAASNFSDLQVLPRYQRRGLGVAITRNAMEICPLTLAYPNELALGVFQKLGFEIRAGACQFRLPLRPNNHPEWQHGTRNYLGMIAGLTLRVVMRARTLTRGNLSALPASPDILEAFSKKKGDNALRVPRTQDFLKWRILDHPLANEHTIISLANDPHTGCSALTRVFERDGYRRLHILSLNCDSATISDLSRFFGGIVRWALQQDIDVIGLVSSDRRVSKIARWWFPAVIPINFAVHADDREGFKFLAQGDFDLEFIDASFDLQYA